MKLPRILATACLAGAVVTEASAIAISSKILKWEGGGGYSAEVRFTYDSTVPLLMEDQEYQFPGYLIGTRDIWFNVYDSSGVDVMVAAGEDRGEWSVKSAGNGMRMYDFLDFTFDTVLGEFVNGPVPGYFSVGFHVFGRFIDEIYLQGTGTQTANLGIVTYGKDGSYNWLGATGQYTIEDWDGRQPGQPIKQAVPDSLPTIFVLGGALASMILVGRRSRKAGEG